MSAEAITKGAKNMRKRQRNDSNKVQQQKPKKTTTTYTFRQFEREQSFV